MATKKECDDLYLKKLDEIELDILANYKPVDPITTKLKECAEREKTRRQIITKRNKMLNE